MQNLALEEIGLVVAQRLERDLVPERERFPAARAMLLAAGVIHSPTAGVPSTVSLPLASEA
jgi:hypothetical protein